MPFSLLSQIGSKLGSAFLRSPAPKYTRSLSLLNGPRKFRSRKSQKGRIPVPLGGSLAGTSLSFGTFGIRVLQGAVIKAATLHAAQTTLKRKLKAVKGAQIWTRVFPATPITSKGNETRMGKGKGAFDHWATRVSQNRILFEIGGPGLHDQVAREAMRQVADKLPVRTEFVTKGAERQLLTHTLPTRSPPPVPRQ